MSQPWVLNLLRSSSRSPRACHTSTKKVLERQITIPSNQKRQYPQPGNTRQQPGLARQFGLGIVVGVVCWASWSFYESKRDRDSFLTYKLVAKEPVSSTASIFYLEPTTASNDLDLYKEAWRQGIWNVHFKQPQLQIIRAYTPLPPAQSPEGNTKEQLRFLIRRDAHGEVSSYLHKLPVGAGIELRGPNVEYHLTPDVQQVVFLAGGTGIAPALQVAHTMFDAERNRKGDSDGSTGGRKLHILWANRKREDCQGGISDEEAPVPIPSKSTWSGFFASKSSKPLPIIDSIKGPIVKELEELKRQYPGQITVDYFVNEESSWINEDIVQRAILRLDNKSGSSEMSHENRQIIISGPSGFISYLAGPKEWRNGREEQGPVKQLVAHAIAQNPHNIKVWKV